MAKIKERKSESWKPSLNHDDGFISKNKKRKEKRMSLNLAAKKIDSEEFIPIKKSLLALNKSKDTLKSTPNKFLSPALGRKQTPKKKDTPMPAVEGKKIFPVTPIPAAKAFKKNDTPKMKIEPTGTPKMKKEPASTPKNKIESAATPKVNIEPVIKSSLKKKAQKFIDDEAVEGEEPISDKVVKPYVKGQKKKSISFKMDEDNEDSESDDDDSFSNDDIDVPAPKKGTGSEFIDSEASEGEETSDDEDGYYEDLVDSDLDDEDSDESSGSDDDLSDDNDGNDSFESDTEDSEDEDDDLDEQQQLKHKQNKPKVTSPVKNKKSKVQEDSDKDEDEEELPKPKKSADETKAKSKPVPPVIGKKEKVEKTQKGNEIQMKKSKPQENGILKVNEQPKTAKDKKSSDYAGYIKNLSNSVTEDQLKELLISVVGVENLVSVAAKNKNKVAKSTNWLVYVSDEDSLNNLENRKFSIGKFDFKIYKARESKKLVKTKLLVFLPRVPLTVENDEIKSIIESDIGVGKIITLKSKKVNDRLKTRNVLIELADEETLKKVIYKGSYSCNGSDLVVRQAFESGSQIPIYKIVFSGIPEQATEALVKKAVESKVGNGSVITVKFSFRKKSFAFVTLSNEQAQKKLLEPGIEISVKGTKLQVLEFKPRLPKKRGPNKKKDKQVPAAKKQKTDNQKSEPTSSEPKSKKKRRNKNKPAVKSESQSNSPVKYEPKSQQQQNKKKSESQSNAAVKSEPKSQQQQNKIKSESQLASPTKPQQNAQQKNKKKQSLKPAQNNNQNSSKKQKSQQQPASTSPSSPSKNKKAKKAQNQVPDKKADLNNKLEAKKNKLKDKKMKKKQAGASD